MTRERERKKSNTQQSFVFTHVLYFIQLFAFHSLYCCAAALFDHFNFISHFDFFFCRVVGGALVFLSRFHSLSNCYFHLFLISFHFSFSYSYQLCALFCRLFLLWNHFFSVSLSLSSYKEIKNNMKIRENNKNIDRVNEKWKNQQQQRIHTVRRLLYQQNATM